MLVRDDGGREWAERTPPEGLISPAIDPHDRDRIVVSGEDAAFESVSADELYVALHDGTVRQSNDGGASWSVRLTP